jgi:hypothetical protein
MTMLTLIASVVGVLYGVEKYVQIDSPSAAPYLPQNKISAESSSKLAHI